MDNKIKILIADNTGSFRDDLIHFFNQKKDIEIIGIAENGEETVKMVIEKQPDILIIDIILPGQDGLWVLEELHAMGIDKQLRTIVISSIDNDNVTRLTMYFGARYYMVKPLSLDVLEKRIRQISNFMSEEKEHIDTKDEIELTDEILEHKIAETLSSIGISANIKGYQYLKKAIFMAVRDDKAVSGITKKIYPVIGELYETTASKVERAMRHAIESSWLRGGRDFYNKIVGCDAVNKPTNGHFIANIAEYLKLKKY